MDNSNFGPNVIYFALGITESRPAGAFWADKIVFWARNASRRSLLGGSNCIFGYKSVPQGPFGRMKLYFEPEKRPAGAFWADKIVFLCLDNGGSKNLLVDLVRLF